MVDLTFTKAERSDLIVTFAEPRDVRALHELARLPGVHRAEPFRVTGARLKSDGKAVEYFEYYDTAQVHAAVA